jgi:hypothetical protein
MTKKAIATLFAALISATLCVGAIAATCEKITEADIKDVQDLPLKPEEILALPSESKSAKGVLYKFEMWMEVNLPRKSSDDKYQKDLAKLKAKHGKKGTVPFRFTADIEVKEPKDSKYKRYTKGDTWIYIIDSEKKIVYKKKEGNGKLCPS